MTRPSEPSTIGASTVSAIGSDPAKFGSPYNEWAVLAGLRFVLAVIVMCHHLARFTDHANFIEQLGKGGGFIAVLSFFVISGYSMAHSLGGSSDALQFYRRRIWRIYPCYLCALALALLPWLVFTTLLPHAPKPYLGKPAWIELLQAAVFLQGVTMQGDIAANGVIWSLGVEAWLYLFSPWLNRATLRVLCALAALSAVVYMAHGYLSSRELHSEIDGVAFAALAWAFLGGFAYYRFRDRLCSPIYALLGVAIASCYQSASAEQFGPLTFAFTLALMAYGRRIALTPPIQKTLLRLGDLSFCLYLVHVPVMNIASGLEYRNGYVIAASCLGLAVLTLHCIDLPIRAYRRRQVQRSRPVSAAAPTGAPNWSL